MADQYDEALKLLTGTGPEYGKGRANDGAIVAASLAALERPQTVVPWLKAYLERLQPMPPARVPLTRNNWRTALGKWNRVSDWIQFFRRELEQVPWTHVVADWLPRLAPGLSGGAGHPLLRTAEALHHLATEESSLRKGELAESLGYWAGRYLKLPGILGSTAAGNLSPSDALARITWQHKDRPPRFKDISAGLKNLTGFPSFAGVINLVAIPPQPRALISQITGSMARVQLAHNQAPAKLVPFIHGLTVPGALRSVLPHLREEDMPALLRYGWQFAGAIYTIYGRANPVESWDQPPVDTEALADRAVATGNEHAILLCRTCLQENAEEPNAAYLAAAWDAAGRLMPASLNESRP